MHEGWLNIIEALEEYTQDLSLPEGIESALDIFSADLQHRLWLQTCFDPLSGLGQDEELILEDEEEYYRIEDFISLLRDHKDTVQYFDLNLETLLTRVIIPKRDKELFIKMMMEQIGLPTTKVPIADYL